MSETQEKNPWIRFVYNPCDDGHQEVVDFVIEHDLPVTLDSYELAPKAELRDTHMVIETDPNRIMADLKKRFAHLITPMPS